MRRAQRPRLLARRTIRLGVEQLEDRTVPSLVGAYAFDEGAGATVLDSSGAGNGGILFNAVWSTAGKYSGALRFNGSMTSLVTVPDSASLHLTSGMTVE